MQLNIAEYQGNPNKGLKEGVAGEDFFWRRLSRLAAENRAERRTAAYHCLLGLRGLRKTHLFARTLIAE